jgi:hypothetical protein
MHSSTIETNASTIQLPVERKLAASLRVLVSLICWVSILYSGILEGSTGDRQSPNAAAYLLRTPTTVTELLSNIKTALIMVFF